MPVCQAIEDSAMALGRIALGTRLGASAESAGPLKARTTPNSTATAKSEVSRNSSVQVSQASAPAPKSWRRMVSRATVFRLKRSAARPEKGERTNSGRNWSRPISASWPDAPNASIPLSRAIVYVCHPMIRIIAYWPTTMENRATR